MRQEMCVLQSVRREIEMNAECYNHRLEISQENYRETAAQLEHVLRECAEHGHQEALQEGGDLPE